MSIYQSHGYKTRREYLQSIAEDYGVPLGDVIMLAEILGPNEDFDGLIVHVEDRADQLADRELWG